MCVCVCTKSLPAGGSENPEREKEKEIASESVIANIFLEKSDVLR